MFREALGDNKLVYFGFSLVLFIICLRVMFKIGINGVEQLQANEVLEGRSLASQHPVIMENCVNIEPVSTFSRLADVDLGCEKE